MKSEVLFSAKGKAENTDNKKDSAKQIALAIAAGAHVSAYPIESHTFVTDMSILFIGCEVNGGGKIDRTIRRLLQELSQNKVKLVAVFSIAKNGTVSALAEIRSILEPKGIKVCEEEFFRKKVSALGGKGFPTEQDTAAAKDFGAMIMAKYRNV